MRITVHWHVMPCNMVADYWRFGGTTFCHLTLQQLLRNVGNLPPDGAVSHSSRQHPQGVAEFQPRLVSGQSLELDVSIVICDNLTDVQPLESLVNTANHCFLPHKFAKMLFYRTQSDSFPFKQLLSCYFCCRPAQQKLVRPPGNSRQQDKSPSIVRYRYYRNLAYGEDTTIDTRTSHRVCRHLNPAYSWSKSPQLHSVAHRMRHRPYISSFPQYNRLVLVLPL
jgi:hypothetical protein